MDGCGAFVEWIFMGCVYHQVQHIRNKFTAKAYEHNARVALEMVRKRALSITAKYLHDFDIRRT